MGFFDCWAAIPWHLRSNMLLPQKGGLLLSFWLAVFFFNSITLAMPMRQSTSGFCDSVGRYVDQFKGVLGDSVYIKIVVGGREKHIRIIKNNWSHDFTIVTRVVDKAESENISRYLDTVGLDSVEVFSPASFISEALPLPSREGTQEFVCHIKTKKNLSEFIGALSGRLVAPRELIPTEIKTMESMRQWVFWKYFEYRSNRTPEEKQILLSLRTAGYIEIQSGLREKPGNIPERLQSRVETIDRQFDGNSIDRDLTFYHVSANADFEHVWTRLQGGERLQELPLDAAYTFTNLSKDFVVWWNNHQFKGKGVILEIQASKGAKAVPMDRLDGEGDFLRLVSELEFVLPRGSRFVPTGVGTDSNGIRIIYCRYE